MNLTGLLNAAFIATMTATMLSSGCGGTLGTSGESPEVRRVIEQSVENLVFVDGGTFMLGDIGTLEGKPYTVLQDDNKPPVEVILDSFSISRYETTWGELMVYLEDTGRANLYKDTYVHRKYIISNNDPMSPNYHHKPARSPNYQEAEGYCMWLAQKTGLAFALPTEAQWEYAARSRGKSVPYATDTGEIEKDPYLRRPTQYVDPSIPPEGNALAHSSLKRERRPVGSYPPNPLGLYDMTGNNAEWTQDWYQEDFYQHAPRNNPSGPAEPPDPDKSLKVVRDWAGHGHHIGGGDTVFFRGSEAVHSSANGFRCVVNSSGPIN